MSNSDDEIFGSPFSDDDEEEESSLTRSKTDKLIESAGPYKPAPGRINCESESCSSCSKHPIIGAK